MYIYIYFLVPNWQLKPKKLNADDLVSDERVTAWVDGD